VRLSAVSHICQRLAGRAALAPIIKPESSYGDKPLPSRQGLCASASAPAGVLCADHAAAASRDVYEKHGFVVGRSRGSTADGKYGSKFRPSRPKLLSYQLMLLGDLQDQPSAERRRGPRKASKQWRLCPENSFVFDPRTFLPVPRGGWDQHPLALEEWPAPPSSGSRDFAVSAKDPLHFSSLASNTAHATDH